MHSIQQDIQNLQLFLKEYQLTHKPGLLFGRNDKVVQHINYLIVALKQFDEVKYAPENAEEKQMRELALKKLMKLFNKEPSTTPEKLSSKFKKIQINIKENLDYYSSEPQFVYWRGSDEPIASKPPGIEILCNDNRPKSNRLSGDFPLDFKERAIESLNYIVLTDSGRKLLTHLLKDKDGIKIFPAAFKRANVTIPYNNMNAMHGVALELLSSTEKFNRMPQDATRAALDQAALANGAADNKYQWLADQINAMPEFSDTPEMSKPFLKKPISASEIQAWMHGDKIVMDQHSKEVQEHITNAAIVALHPYAQPSVGSGSVVYFNCFPEFPINEIRPPAIGLAHELIHAYYNSKGEGPAYPDQGAAAVLGEYIVVGLGPWSAAPISENTIRAEWKKILDKIPQEDVQQSKDPGPRDTLKKPVELTPAPTSTIVPSHS